MVGVYFVAMVFGVPLLIFAVSVLAGYIGHRSDAEVLDWKPTRSPEREAALAASDVDQMRASLNELRRRRGAPESALEQATGHPPRAT